MKKRECETDGCGNAVRPQMLHCDDCIVEMAKRRKRERETTESGIRGGQGRSGQDVEDSALFAAVGIAGMVVLLAVLLAALIFNAGQEAGQAEAAARQAHVRMSDE